MKMLKLIGTVNCLDGIWTRKCWYGFKLWNLGEMLDGIWTKKMCLDALACVCWMEPNSLGFFGMAMHECVTVIWMYRA